MCFSIYSTVRTLARRMDLASVPIGIPNNYKQFIYYENFSSFNKILLITGSYHEKINIKNTKLCLFIVIKTTLGI